MRKRPRGAPRWFKREASTRSPVLCYPGDSSRVLQVKSVLIWLPSSWLTTTLDKPDRDPNLACGRTSSGCQSGRNTWKHMCTSDEFLPHFWLLRGLEVSESSRLSPLWPNLLAPHWPQPLPIWIVSDVSTTSVHACLRRPFLRPCLGRLSTPVFDACFYARVYDVSAPVSVSQK